MRGSSVEIDFDMCSRWGSFLDFCFIIEGSCSFGEIGVRRNVEAQLFVAPMTGSGKANFEGKWEILVVRIPTEALVPMTPELPSSITVYERAAPIERSMYDFARNLITYNKDEISSIEQYAFEQLLLEMAGASLLNRLGGGERLQGAPHIATLARAKAVIAQQSSDPSLDPSLVADEVKTSLRQLQSFFSIAGTSIAAEIRLRRALVAHSLLVDAIYDVLTTDQIAERSGFRTVASMRRAMGEIYGMTPRQIRHSRTG
ncbi:helix-turn-helix domain-containing protein [Glutamicibacter arilaitensis]|uniref:helix-turn-helix transcriptional regulator n=1 Tax=Glutamicibacter arilaitensis TaxID=256701 RepID=UPI003F9B7ED9